MTETLTLHDKLCLIAKEAGYVQKKDKVAFGSTKYSYASAEDVLSKVRECRVKYGVVFSSKTDVLHTTPDLQNVIVRVSLAISDGSRDAAGNLIRITAEGVGQGADKGDKAVMKAETAAHKYAMAMLLTMSWGDDPEADTSIYEEPKETKKAKAKEVVGEGTTTVDMLKSVITLSKSLAELEKVREQVLALRNTDPKSHAVVVELYKKQKASFQESVNGN